MTAEPTTDREPMLYERRRRLEEIRRAESQGESFWTDRFDDQVRAKLHHAVDKFLTTIKSLELDLARIVRTRTLLDVGLVTLSDDPLILDSIDLLNGIRYQDEDVILTLIEAIATLPDWAKQDPVAQVEYDLPQGKTMDATTILAKLFAQKIRAIFREHRISFDLVEGQIVPIDSLEPHKSIIEPTLTLLAGRSGFDKVEAAYRKALGEIHGGTPDDAITDAGTALQEALETLGCEGNSLGPLAKSAKSRGVITGYDKQLVDWVSADRSNKGDAHNVGPTSVEDAWLVVHVVGALILRIVDGPLRGLQASR